MVKKDFCSPRADSVGVTDINQALSENCREKEKQGLIIKNNQRRGAFLHLGYGRLL